MSQSCSVDANTSLVLRRAQYLVQPQIRSDRSSSMQPNVLDLFLQLYDYHCTILAAILCSTTSKYKARTDRFSYTTRIDTETSISNHNNTKMNCFKVILENPALAKSVKPVIATATTQTPRSTIARVTTKLSISITRRASSVGTPTGFTPLRLSADHLQQFRRQLEAYNFGQARQHSQVADYSSADDEFPQMRQITQSGSGRNEEDGRQQRTSDGQMSLLLGATVAGTVLGAAIARKQNNCDCSDTPKCKSSKDVGESLLATFP